MDEFIIKGGDDFLKITIHEIEDFPEKIGYWGGYDIQVIVEINADNFMVKSTMNSSTGEIFDFYNQLSKTNQLLTGSVYLRNYESNLDVEMKYDINGHISIEGSFSSYRNLLKFSFGTDQSYIPDTLTQLKAIVEKYGGMDGVK